MRTWMFAGCWIVVALAGGCRYSTPYAASPADAGGRGVVKELYINRELIVPDLPYPNGFRLDAGRSRTWATHGNVRVINHFYTGSGDMWAAGRFYLREMPLKSWTPVSDQLAAGELRLRFVKGSERCEININKISFARLEIDLSVFPENIAAAP